VPGVVAVTLGGSRVFAPGEWGSIVNGGAWLTVGGAGVDLIYRAGLDAIQDRLAQPGSDLGSLVSDVRARLELTDDVWAGG
jgi:hypothetical protein